ncbi:hypothetical protein BGZ73_003582 [Actinomortierella ambigua]|nr:hypothetical protein BGZ73_003582 [Actinomortierella ambigua]
MISTSLGLGIARTVVSGVDQAIGMAVKTVAGETNIGQVGLSPSQVTSLPFRAALLGINFSDVLVQTILEAVDGSVNLALTTIQDGMDLMDSLFGTGPYRDHPGQASETFREVWMILSREWASMNGASYPALEGLRLLMAYVAIQFATAEAWERQRVEQHCQLVGLCYEALDEQNGSKNAWRAIGPWPAEWSNQQEDPTLGMSASWVSTDSSSVRMDLTAPSPPPVHVVHSKPESLTRSTATFAPASDARNGQDNHVLAEPLPRYHLTVAGPLLEPLPIDTDNVDSKEDAEIGKPHQQPSRLSSSLMVEGMDTVEEDDAEKEAEEEPLYRKLHNSLLHPPPSLESAPIVQPTAPLSPEQGNTGDAEGDDSTLYPILDWRDEQVPFSRAQTPVLTRRAGRMEKLDTPPPPPLATMAEVADNEQIMDEEEPMQPRSSSPSSTRPSIRSSTFPAGPLPNLYEKSNPCRRHTAYEPRRGRDDDEPNTELRRFLADSYRFSRFCSAMYGEEVLAWLGSPDIIPPPPPGTGSSTSKGDQTSPDVSPVDHHFLAYTGTPLGSILYSSDEAATLRTGSLGESEKYYAPRYYILDDAESKQIVLVLRGTKSLHDLMVDLTCDAADLVLDHETQPPVTAAVDPLHRRHYFHHRHGHHDNTPPRPYKVHAGFLKAARTMASVDTVGIQERIHWALQDRPDYGLLIIGHSLGAGIASVLALLWADPATGFTPPVAAATSTTAGRTHPMAAMPLPPGRRVRCYAYGSPKVMCPRLSRRSTKIITSISYGDDVVGRLSLGSVRNIGHAMRALLTLRRPSPTTPAAASSTTSANVALGPHDDEPVLNMEPMEQETEATATDSSSSSSSTPSTSIGLELVQKVVRWRLTKEAHLLEEFMAIRRLMHREMRRHETLNLAEDEEDDHDYSSSSSDSDDDERAGAYSHYPASSAAADKCPSLVPGGKVLWIRPSATEQAIQDEDERAHPVDHVLHQMEWDHPRDHHPSLADRFKKNWKTTTEGPEDRPVHRGGGVSEPSTHTRRPSTTAGHDSSLPQPHGNDQQRVSNRVLYRMYATTRPEHVFEEMLFSRRMWSDHLPLTYEFVLAGKHAVPPSSVSDAVAVTTAPSSSSHATSSSRPSSPSMAAGVASTITRALTSPSS